jgi:hypothetical protein
MEVNMKRPIVSLSAALVVLVGAGQNVLAATGFTTQVSPPGQTNATEPSVAVDRSDGTIYIAWQASGTHVARSDDGGRSFVQTPIVSVTGRDLGDVSIRVGGPTACPTTINGCVAGSHRVYVTSLERLPFTLQTRLASSDDRGASWTINSIAAVNPSLIDRPWLAVDPSKVSALQDKLYIAYHDFTVSQIWVATSTDGGTTFGTIQSDVLSFDAFAEANSFCNTIPSGIEVDPQTGEVYVQWITADPKQNAQGCNLTQTQNFHHVYMAHSSGAIGLGITATTTWDVHSIFDGAPTTNTDDIFATIAVDDSGTPGVGGNVYSVFPDNLNGPAVFDIWFSHSSNKGATWSVPVKVNSDKGTHFFPWIAAGNTGRVDFIWYNSPDYTPSDVEASPWYVTFAQTINGTDAVPKFNQTAGSSGVIHVGGICTNGIFCAVNAGNRDLADSISIAIDRGGSAALAYTDQGRVLHGPTWIDYTCLTAQQTAIVGANAGLSCKGPSS